MEKIRKYYIHIILLLLVLVGFELRFAVSNVPLWYDEGHSVLVAIQKFPFGIDNFLFTKDFQHTPFYFYFLHFWLKIFGNSEILMRMSSVIFGLACIPMCYVVGNKLCNKKVGLISALLITVSPLFIYYSIEIRMYIMVTFLSLVSMNYLLDFDANHDKKSLIKLLAANTLIPYLLIGGIVFNIGQFISYTIYFMVTQRECVRKFMEYITYQVYQLILLIPYFAIAIYYAVKRSGFIMFHIPSLSFMHIMGNLQNFFSARVGALFWVNYSPWYIDFMFFITVIIPIIYFICALVSAFKEKDSKLYLVFSIVLISYIIVLLSGIFRVIVIVPRYIIFVVPFMFILASVGFSKLKKWHLALFLIFFSLFSTYFLFKDESYYKTKYNAIYDSINYYKSRNLTNEDIVYKPFSSSVAFIYDDGTVPKTPPIELLHEMRKPYNELIYDGYQIVQMRYGFVDETWYNIVKSEGHISNSYYRFLKKTYIDAIKPGRYIVMAVYGPDNQALVDRAEYLKRINSIQAVHNDRILAALYKAFDDSKNIFMEYCDLIEVAPINDTTYFLFRKRPYKK
ncbi:glycosyltransferase family 39 protein [bacterium]|nr:glycosyltransferase family 39 protein [bacterium]